MLFHRSILSSFLALALVPVVSLSATTTEKPRSLGASFNGITYQMSEQTVFKKLGKPQKTGQTIDECSKATLTRLFYPGIIVDIDEFEGNQRLVTGITLTGRNLGIDRIVKVGDHISKAKKAYKKEINLGADKKTWYITQPYGEGVAIAFVVNKANIITKISLVSDC